MNRLQLKNSNPAHNMRNQIISVLSGKGGVGKSVFVYNLADSLAQIGKNVLIIDADVNFGNQHVLANLNVDYGFAQYAKSQLSLKEATVQVSQNLSMLASVNSIGLFEEIDIPTIAECMNRIRRETKEYDVVLIDHSSGVNKHASVMAYASDKVLTVLVPELTSISDSYGLFKYLHDLNPNAECRFLVNRATTSDEAEYIYAKLCAVAERFVESIPKYFGFISENDDFRKAVASQQSLRNSTPDSKAVEELNTLAHKLLGTESVVGTINSFNRINKTTAVADIKE